MNFVKELSQSQSVNKYLSGTLMGTLTTMKFDGSHTMHKHITEITNIVVKLRSMEMEVSESFQV